jgi:hypothetical protein
MINPIFTYNQKTIEVGIRADLISCNIYNYLVPFVYISYPSALLTAVCPHKTHLAPSSSVWPIKLRSCPQCLPRYRRVHDHVVFPFVTRRHHLQQIENRQQQS